MTVGSASRRFRRALGHPPVANWQPLVEYHPPGDVGTLETNHFRNSTYWVSTQPAPSEGWVYVRIERFDGMAAHAWEDFQRIKNQVVGPECEAIEIYPAESRLLNLGNVYHLWVNKDPTFRLDLGFHQGRRVGMQ